jgi:hypothetical protein
VQEAIGENEYRCCLCGGIFEKAWTDEEAALECAARESTKRLTTAELEEGFGVVCDDCYKQLPAELRQ